MLIKLFEQIENIINENKRHMSYQINNSLVQTYFSIGKIIVENEQNGNIRAEYGKDILKKLSKSLTNKFGSGFSLSGLYNMRLFYNRYKNFQPLAGNLSWSHYCYLIYIEDEKERSFYEKECINSKWAKRELKKQIDSSLFQRLLLSDGKTNRKKVLELSKKGQTINSPTDILKEPYVFEFLGIKENKPLLENDMEKSLINHLSSFLMELGKGFMYVGNQQRITSYNIHYYNKEIKDEFDNDTIGIILCKGKKEITLEYALGGISNNLFASTYTYYIPNKEELLTEIERVLNDDKKIV